MPTFREVNIKIESLIDELDSSGLTMGEPERTESAAVGYLRFGEDATLTYTESGEYGSVVTELWASGDTVTVKRTGAIVSELRFTEGLTHTSLYEVPPYKFDVSVKARRVRVDLKSEGGVVDVLYDMDIGGARKAVRMKIWIQAS
ncbi:MAG: DUF1934 domain-containing protein [Clostridia bacterium]|nr:DUF1934 domain-containing protein [Clostridia bacterium]